MIKSKLFMAKHPTFLILKVLEGGGRGSTMTTETVNENGFYLFINTHEANENYFNQNINAHKITYTKQIWF